jgi:hypothetical protein
MGIASRFISRLTKCSGTVKARHTDPENVFGVCNTDFDCGRHIRQRGEALRRRPRESRVRFRLDRSIDIGPW